LKKTSKRLEKHRKQGWLCITLHSQTASCPKLRPNLQPPPHPTPPRARFQHLAKQSTVQFPTGGLAAPMLETLAEIL